MKELNKDFVRKFTEYLSDKGANFLLNNIDKKASYKTGDLLDIILSSYLSACFQNMQLISEMSDNKEMPKIVLKFIEEITNKLFNVIPISNIEMEGI